MSRFKEALLDGDLIVYSICAAAEYGNDIAYVRVEEILSAIDSKIIFLKNRTEAEKVRVFFSGKRNFRFDIMPEYKAHRADKERPYYLDTARKYVEAKWNAESMEGVEADDLMCIYQKQDDSTIIVTIDKDMLQCKGWHYRWETQHKGEEFIFVDNVGELNCKISDKGTKKISGHGPLFLCWQLLTGDSTDNVMGCGVKVDKVYKTGKKAGQAYQAREGIGAVEAYDLLLHCTSYAEGMKVVRKQYVIMFGDDWEVELLKQGRCLYMTTRITDGKLQLWHHDTSRLNESLYCLETRMFG
jgi:5'-3' exonuclease